ncbi:MAG: (2Fe-2S)-binding protein [Clostridia bacterium]|nr:(2Fe-2S)-binding protein [Clostridia bacterium]
MENTIICRCSDVTLLRVRQLIADGYTSMDEIKRITRLGMGSCQGKTCSLLIMRELAAAGFPPATQTPQTTRPPAVGVKLELIAKEAENNEKQR